MSRPIRSAAPTRLTASDRQRLLRAIGCRHRRDVLAMVATYALVFGLGVALLVPDQVRAFLLSIVGGTP